MALATASTLRYEPGGSKEPTKSGIRVISEMSTPSIVVFVLYRHRYPISVIINILLIGYILYDKIGRLFF